MSKTFKLRVILNKANGQINLNPNSKDLPVKKIKDIIKKDPSTKVFLKMRFEGFE